MTASCALAGSNVTAPSVEAPSTTGVGDAFLLSCRATLTVRYRPSARLTVIESIFSIVPGTVAGSGTFAAGEANIFMPTTAPAASTTTATTARMTRLRDFLGGSGSAGAVLAPWFSCRAAVDWDTSGSGGGGGDRREGV